MDFDELLMAIFLPIFFLVILTWILLLLKFNICSPRRIRNSLSKSISKTATRVHEAKSDRDLYLEFAAKAEKEQIDVEKNMKKLTARKTAPRITVISGTEAAVDVGILKQADNLKPVVVEAPPPVTQISKVVSANEIKKPPVTVQFVKRMEEHFIVDIPPVTVSTSKNTQTKLKIHDIQSTMIRPVHAWKSPEDETTYQLADSVFAIVEQMLQAEKSTINIPMQIQPQHPLYYSTPSNQMLVKHQARPPSGIGSLFTVQQIDNYGAYDVIYRF